MKSAPAAITSTSARLLLVGFVAVVIAGGVFETRGVRGKSSTGASAQRDVDLFDAVVMRMRDGERYYDAMGTELRSRGYPIASVFNWRTPLLYSTTAVVRSGVVRTLLMSLALALLFLAVIVLGKRHPAALSVGLFAELGAVVAVMVPTATLITEAWAGILLGCSLCAYRLRRWRSAAALGLLALFVRELVAPYVLICAVLALWKKRWDEATIWSAGAVAYSIYFGYHVMQVTAHQGPGDLAQARSWFYGGGPAFVLQTLRTNAWLLVTPSWLPSASGLLAILLAACVWTHTDVHLRTTTIAYLTLFLFIGQPFNSYWGLLMAPAWALATADGVDALRDWVTISRESDMLSRRRS